MIIKQTAVIGHGFVGQAVSSILKISPLIIDIKDSDTTLDYVIKTCQMIFICLPTPTINEKCDDSLVIEYIEKLKDFSGLVVVKSTVPLATVEKILQIRNNIIIWPELLREKYANEDIQNPNIIVIGSDDQSFLAIENFIKQQTYINHKDNIHHVSPEEASIFKYTVNSFLATKVVFMHQMYVWLKERNLENSWPTVANLLAKEGRIGSSHLMAPGEHGLGFGGSCFPKDTQALLVQANSDNVVLGLLKQVIEENEKLKKLLNK